MLRIILILSFFSVIGCKNDSEEDPAPSIPHKRFELFHGIGFTCLGPDAPPMSKLFCWGDAVDVGITSVDPQLIASPADGIIAIHVYDDGVCWVNLSGTNCAGSNATTAHTWAESTSCVITGQDTYRCPGLSVDVDFN